MTVDLITFGDGLPEYRRAARRVAREAQAAGVFSSIRSAHLADLGDDFRRDHASILRERGLGYWLWKPYLVLEWMKSATSEFLLYVDAGCVLNFENDRARRRFDEYLLNAAETTLTCFSTLQPESVRTKRDLLHRLDVPEPLRQSAQIMGGVLVFRRGDIAVELAEQWWTLAVEDGYRFLDDSPSAGGEDPEFVEHRHDQSILSCLAKLRGIDPFGDETWFPSDWSRSGQAFPIWAPRHRTGRAFQPSRTSPVSDLAWRLVNSIEYRIHARRR